MEGPLAHATRTRVERAFIDNLSDHTRVARDRASGSRPERMSKRLLVDVSHAVEKAVMAGTVEHPTVVVALFQQLPYFDRERAVYEAMAAAGVTAVVGFVAGEAHPPPEGVTVVELDPAEALADEWTVVALGPRAGAFLVATDQHTYDAGETAVEPSRIFDGRWGFSRAQAATELARLRFALGTRLAPEVLRTVDDLLATTMPAGGDAAGSAGTPGEMWATTSLYHMIDRMRDAHAGTRELREQIADAHAAAGARAVAGTDAASGLPDGDFLARWTPRGGPGALQVGVALFDIPAFDDEALASPRAAYHAGHRVAAALTEPLGPVDVAVRLDPRTFVVLVPGASAVHLNDLADRIGEGLALASEGHPGVPLTARVATTTTRGRPLPIDDLRAALGHAEASGEPVDAGRTPAGGRIMVAVGGPVGAAVGEAADGPPAVASVPEPTDPDEAARAGRHVRLVEDVPAGIPGPVEGTPLPRQGYDDEPRVPRPSPLGSTLARPPRPSAPTFDGFDDRGGWFREDG
ncbi:DICT sensory domain-containing protein [Actinomycetospora sp. CA-084318]|uniref:DICT sensory domain-containing protein n=1 Tax=Actinomycetospora sp. CA-084318 TaxID=3239892 RepID=UPI003D974655